MQETQSKIQKVVNMHRFLSTSNVAHDKKISLINSTFSLTNIQLINLSLSLYSMEMTVSQSDFEKLGVNVVYRKPVMYVFGRSFVPVSLMQSCSILICIGNVMQAAGCSAFEADRESRLLMESEAVTDSPYAAMGPREIESKMSKMKEKKEKVQNNNLY